MIQSDKNGAAFYMLYSPDQRYEISMYSGENRQDRLYMVIEKERGYWNYFVIYTAAGKMNMQVLVTTGDVAFVYVANYLTTGYDYNDRMTFMDPSVSCDLLSSSSDSTTVTVYINALNGISSFETDSDSFITSFTTAAGVTYRVEDMLSDSGFQFISGMDFPISDGNYAELTLRCPEGLTQSEMVRQLEAAITSIGITFKYKLNSVTNNISGAEEIAKNFDKHYVWNGYLLSNYAALEKTIAAHPVQANAR